MGNIVKSVEKKNGSANKVISGLGGGIVMSLYKYISVVPKPLLDDFVHNKVIPFVGAGFSKNADIPQGIIMPDWKELGRRVANEIPNYKYENNALDALSYYETLFSRPKLIETLSQELHKGKIQPGETYTAFCELFTNIVCTTNFDSLLEDAYRALKQPISVVVTEDKLSIRVEGETKIIKLHGDFIYPDRMIITEEDYDLFIERNPVLSTYVSSLLITHTLLLIGYSLDDYDFRNLWQILNSRLGKMTRLAYCITVGATEEEIARYKRRNIRVINLPGKACEYKNILRDFFREIRRYIIDEQAKLAICTVEKIDEQLLIPAERNNLCFVSCAPSRISQLKSIIDPILRKSGITPIRIEDMLIPGENWMDVSRMIISKSNMAIIDVSDNSPNVSYELALIQAEKRRDEIIIIAEKNSSVSYTMDKSCLLLYSLTWNGDMNDIDVFQDKLFKLCSQIISSYKDTSIPFEEANRLLEKREYSSAIISALSELELLFQKRHNIGWMRNSFPIMVNEFVKQGVYSNSMYRKVLKQWELRNKIIHGGYKATEKDAKCALEFVKVFNEKDEEGIDKNLF